MTDHSDLIERARAYQPYNQLNDGDLVRQLLDALSSQSLSLSEAREALKPFAAAHRKGAKVQYLTLDGWIGDLTDEAARALKALENGPAVLADATNDPASLSPLRKGAEDMREALVAARKVMRNAWGAVTSDQVVDKQVDKMLRKGWEAADAALVSGSREDGADA